MSSHKTEWIKGIVGSTMLCIPVFAILVIVKASSYTVLVSDDFAHANGVGVLHTSFFPYLGYSAKYSIKEYMNWQGTYFSMFIQALLSPINGFGMRQLRLEMTLNALLFFGSLLFFESMVMKRIGIKEGYIKMVLLFLGTVPLCSFDFYFEVFTWFSGAVSYSIPLSLLLLGLTFFIQTEENKVCNATIAAIFGVLAMGGSLTICGLGCFVAFLICVCGLIRRKVSTKKRIVILALWVMAAIANFN